MRRCSTPCLCFAAALLGGLALVQPGCSPGHGKYTSEFKDQAIGRLNALKSATAFDMGQADLESGNLERAYDHATESVGLTPQAPTSHLLLGRVLIEMEQPELAMGSLDEAIALDPFIAEPRYYKGSIYERFGEPELALGAYYSAFSLDPSNVQYLLAAAEMHMELGQPEWALDLLADHDTRFRFAPAVRQTLGHIALIDGETDRAAELFREASLLAPDDSAILEDLARVQVVREQYAEAERTLARLLRDEDVAEARRDLVHLRVRCLIEVDRPMDARRILTELVRTEDGESDIEAWRQMGTIALLTSDPRGLRKAADRLIAIAPDRHEGYFLLAVWQQANDSPEAAVRTLDRAIIPAKAAGTAEPAMLQATIYIELGEIEKAAVAARHALEADPEDPLAREVYAMLSSPR